MSLPTSIHDIKTLVISHHPLIVIETVEEDRVEELLSAAASQLEGTLCYGILKPPSRIKAP